MIKGIKKEFEKEEEMTANEIIEDIYQDYLLLNGEIRKNLSLYQYMRIDDFLDKYKEK